MEHIFQHRLLQLREPFPCPLLPIAARRATRAPHR